MNLRVTMPCAAWLAGCIGLLGLLWLFGTRLFLIHTISYTKDSLFSADAQQEIMAYCDALFKNSYAYHVRTKPQQLVGMQSFSSSYKAPGSLAVTYKAQLPLCSIGNAAVLLADGMVVNARLFSQEVLFGLPRIAYSAAQEGKHYDLLARLIPQLSEDLFKRYAITIASEHDIQLRDHEQKNFIIRADEASLSTKLLHEAESLKHDLIAQKAFTKKGSWIADIRFKNQVIVRNIKSEGGAL